jgi:hypothetical protein
LKIFAVVAVSIYNRRATTRDFFKNSISINKHHSFSKIEAVSRPRLKAPPKCEGALRRGANEIYTTAFRSIKTDSSTPGANGLRTAKIIRSRKMSFPADW